MPVETITERMSKKDCEIEVSITVDTDCMCRGTVHEAITAFTRARASPKFGRLDALLRHIPCRVAMG